VPKRGDGDVHHVVVEQDPDQSPEGPKANLASEGKPRIINPAFKIYAIIVAMIVHLRFQELNETLDARSLGTYVLLLEC
jgi:hypothetical protein